MPWDYGDTMAWLTKPTAVARKWPGSFPARMAPVILHKHTLMYVLGLINWAVASDRILNRAANSRIMIRAIVHGGAGRALIAIGVAGLLVMAVIAAPRGRGQSPPETAGAQTAPDQTGAEPPPVFEVASVNLKTAVGIRLFEPAS